MITSRHYALAPQVYACRSDHHVVFLDVKRDRYQSLELAKAVALGDLVFGWPVASTDAKGDTIANGQALAEHLVECGLLRRNVSPEVGASPLSIALPTMEVIPDYREGTFSFGCLGLVAKIVFLARYTPGCASFEKRVNRVRARNGGREGDRGALNLARTRALLADFVRVKPFLFTSHNACVLETFVLSEFLSHHGIFPRWVFGVKTNPWSAHCWLQHGPTLLNERLDHIRNYVPLMVL